MSWEKFLFACFLFLSTEILFAQGPPITAETPVMLGLEGSGIRTFGKFIQKENAKVYVQPIGIPYNITPIFQVGGIFPIKVIMPDNEQAVGGFADMTFFMKYQLHKKDGKAKTFRVLLNIRQTFPTGNSASSPPLGADIYRTYIGMVIGRISSKIGIYGDFGYGLTYQKDRNNFAYNFSVGIPLLPQKYPQKQLNTFLEFNGNYVFTPKSNTLFISPGLQFIPGRRLLLETSLQLPMLQVNAMGGKTRFMVLLGTRFLLN